MILPCFVSCLFVLWLTCCVVLFFMLVCVPVSRRNSSTTAVVVMLCRPTFRAVLFPPVTLTQGLVPPPLSRQLRGFLFTFWHSAAEFPFITAICFSLIIYKSEVYLMTSRRTCECVSSFPVGSAVSYDLEVCFRVLLACYDWGGSFSPTHFRLMGLVKGPVELSNIVGIPFAFSEDICHKPMNTLDTKLRMFTSFIKRFRVVYTRRAPIP